MNDDKMQELTQEILLVSEMISHLSSREKDVKVATRARSICMQATLIGIS
jgi:hypothetical protein